MKRAPDDPPHERTLVAVACACAGALFLALAWPLRSGQLYLDTDLRKFYLPVRFFYQRALQEGSEFLWFPYEFAGFYLHGEGQAGLYHPLNLLTYRWLPLTLAYDLEILRSYAFALLGAFLLLRHRLALPASAALLGGILFAFSGFQQLHYMHPNVVAAAAHIPWLLLALDALARRGGGVGTALAAPLYALLTASQLLLGHPQALWMSLLIEGLFGLWLWRNGATRGVLSRAAAAKALGALAAAIQLLPTWESLWLSQRADPPPGFVDTVALQPFDLAQLVQPYLFTGRAMARNTIELGLYAGAFGLFALCWLALRRRSLPRLGLGALGLAALGMWLALGASGGLYTLVTALPVIGLFRAPARYILLLHTASALAGALVFAELARRADSLPHRAERALCFGLPLCSAAVGGLLLTFLPGATQGRDLAAVGVALFAATSLLYLLAARGRSAALAALLAFAALDVGFYGASFVQQRNRPAETASFAALIERLSARAGNLAQRKLIGPYESSMVGVRYLSGYVAMRPRRELPVFQPDPLNPEAMAAWRNAMRVSWVATESSGPPLPRFRMLTHAQVSTAPGREIGAIDVAATALVDRPVALDAGEPGTATLLEEKAGELVLATRAPGAQLLAISESYHAGWRAWIDGEPAPVLRAYGDFMGVVVPAGPHRVRLHFEPASFTLGARISALACAAIGVWAVAALVSRRRNAPRDSTVA